MNKTILIFFTSLLLVLFYNTTFFAKSFEVFHSYSFMLSLGITLMLVMALLILLFDTKWTLKPFLISLFIIASVTAYFTDAYGTIISDKMIQNVIETDISEANGLFTPKLLLYLLFLGILPSVWIYKSKIIYPPFLKNLFYKLKMILIIITLLALNIFAFSKTYTSFFREYKPLRYHTIPAYPIYSFVKFLNEKYFTKEIPFTKIGTDATLNNIEKPKLFIFVVGEAARWDHIGLNGYQRDTTPLLKEEKEIINLDNFFSCGTETAVSVPCMFSDLTREKYNDKKAKHRSSLIDVLNYAGIRVLWKDNNSDSKGVAVRIKNYINIKNSCDGECRDEKLLEGLDAFVKTPKTTFIVLHQMGSHGPEYYKRTEEPFKKFTPECRTNQLQECSQESIANAYDNTILYTDYFLEKVKAFLKKYQDKYKVALWYAADHGESLGENGIYLHGLPYFIAPEAQKHPASLLWFSNDFGIDKECLQNLQHQKLSQDYIFSSVLGVMDVKTNVYNPKLDMFAKCR
jgi:lipid A ethanolaminephosphotransferase